MLDWFILITPVMILPIILLFVFVGCLSIPDPIFEDLTVHVRFLPAPDGSERFFNVRVDAYNQDGNRVTVVLSTSPIQDPDGGSEYQLALTELNGEFGVYKLVCLIYLDDNPGPPTIGPIECNFAYSVENTLVVITVDSDNNVTLEGCQPS